jgi:hypothetical protein
MEVKNMITLKYHFIDPYLRGNVDLRDYTKEIKKAVKDFPVNLDKVKRDYYQITILTDTKKNSIVRKLGRQLANNTSLKVYARNKKGKMKSRELFIQKKK